MWECFNLIQLIKCPDKKQGQHYIIKFVKLNPVKGWSCHWENQRGLLE